MKRIRVRTADPKEFERALMREADRFEQYIKNVTAGVVAAVYEGILLYTPVLTGRARKNWFVTRSAPSKRMVDGDQKINEPGYWFTVTGEPLNSEERGVAESIKNAVMQGPVGTRVYVTNNLPYIDDLESGSSAKAPAGMVDIAVSQAGGQGMQARIHREAGRLL
ncbi:MAG TPA: hypothetical protein VGD46_15830 [Rhizobacter sp.]